MRLNGIHSARRPLVVVAAVLLVAAPLAKGAEDAPRIELTRDVVTEPKDAFFSYVDVENFLEALEAIRAGMDRTEALETLYLERGTAGLEIFIEKYGLSADRIAAAMDANRVAYARLPETLSALRAAEPAFRESYAGLKSVYPEAVFPPTWFLVGSHRGIGSGSVEGPLLTIEKEDPSLVEEGLPPTLVHEMIHMQQLALLGPEYFEIFSGPERTLLALSIREGAATFFSEVVAGGSHHKNLAREYLLAHETELWREFEREMLGGETGEWLWEQPSREGQPQDVGYAIGARIVESYYESAQDKGAAAREILGVTDYETFLEMSGYAKRMKRRR